MQVPANADERVLSLACTLLGRHANLVPSLASTAATALVGLLTVPPARIAASLAVAADDAAILEASLALPTLPTLALRVRKSAATALVKLAQVMIASAYSSSSSVEIEKLCGELMTLLASLQEGEEGGVGKELGKAKEMLEQQQQQQLQQLQQQQQQLQQLQQQQQQQEVVKENEMIVLKACMSTTTAGEYACDATSQTHTQTPTSTMEMMESNGNPDEEQAETTTTTAEAAAAAIAAAVAAAALASPPPMVVAATAVAFPVWAAFSLENMPTALDVMKGAEEGGKEGGVEDDAVSIERSVLMSCSSDDEGVPETEEERFDDDAQGGEGGREDTKEEREAREERERENQDEGGLASPTPSADSHSNDATVAQEPKEEGKEGQVSTTPPSSKDTISTEQVVDEKTRGGSGAGSDRRHSSSSSSFSRPPPRRPLASTTAAAKTRSSRSLSRSRSRSRSRSISSSSSDSSRSSSKSRSISREKEQKEKKPSSYVSGGGWSSSSSSSSSGGSTKKKGYQPYEEKLKKTYDDDVETIKILNATLIKLLELDGIMSADRGFYPDDLRVKLSLAPRLWEEIYDGAGIVPNRSNRLYRSRVRRLVWYVEARLGLPCSLKPLRAGEGLEGGGRAMVGERRREEEGEEEREGHYKWGREGGREDRERRGGRRVEERERERVPAAAAVAPAGTAAEEVVEEQMGCHEPTPFVAIKNLSRCGLDEYLTPSSSFLFLTGVA